MEQKNINIENINNEYRAVGGSEAVIKFATNNLDLLAQLSDDNFNDESSDASSEE